MSWRIAFIERFGPGGLAGCTLGDWLRILWRTRFSISPRYWPRAALITFNSAQNSCWSCWEHFRYGAAIETTDVPPPLFVLGIWRSGTTHLFNLMSRDPRFAWPDPIATGLPWNFLLVGRALRPLLERALPESRLIDNVAVNPDSPYETMDDFVAAMADANHYPLDQFKRWYSQAGTPRLAVEEAWDPDEREYYLTVRQHTPATPDQQDKEPLVIPLRMGLLDRQGRAISLKLTEYDREVDECVLEVTEDEQTFVFEDVGERPIASLLRGFSAPVIVEREIDDETLRFQMSFDTDAFNRWDAGQTLVRRRIIAFMADLDNGEQPRLPAADAEAFRAVLNSEHLDDAFKAEALTPPSEEVIGEDLATIEPEKLVAARDSFIHQLAEALEDDLASAWRLRADDREYTLDAESIGRRRLKNLCLVCLGDLNKDEYVQHAIDQVNVERNMTDVIAGLRVLTHLDRAERKDELDEFYAKWRNDPLVTDKWLSLQATSKRTDTIEDALDVLVLGDAHVVVGLDVSRAVCLVTDREDRNVEPRGDGVTERELGVEGVATLPAGVDEHEHAVGEVFERGERPELGIIFEPQILLPILGLAALAALPMGLKAVRGKKGL